MIICHKIINNIITKFPDNYIKLLTAFFILLNVFLLFRLKRVQQIWHQRKHIREAKSHQTWMNVASFTFQVVPANSLFL